MAYSPSPFPTHRAGRVSRRLLTLVVAAALPLILPAPAALAADNTPTMEPAPASPAGGGSIGILLDNDSLFSKSDRHFTHGTLFTYTSAPFPEHTGADGDTLALRAARALAAELPLFTHAGVLRYGLNLGQNIYTPSDISAPVPDPTDRPYAGWLYGGLGLIEDRHGTRPGEPDELTNFEIQLGVVGPASLAEQVQTTWHHLIGARHPNGWSHQLDNEPGLVVYYERKWRYGASLGVGNFAVDAIPDANISLGNIFTYAGAGGIVRFGQDLPDDYGPPRISPSLHGSEYFDPSPRLGWYLFAGTEGRLIGRNIFLDGNTFGSGPSVNKKRFVADLEGGAAIVYDRFRLSYTYVMRSPEFYGQKAADSFGSFSLSYQFGF